MVLVSVSPVGCRLPSARAAGRRAAGGDGNLPALDLPQVLGMGCGWLQLGMLNHPLSLGVPCRSYLLSVQRVSAGGSREVLG
ncbi:MAG: hypothetical protein QHH75_12120 [Bacillota bacterium]|nr:hypothetical protein [Bacillota bacterium]